MLDRCMKRAETSGRSDDNAETIKTRVQNYFDQSVPVVDYYNMFGKVKHIDATGDIASVFAQTKAAIIPQVMCILGPQASGKTTIGQALASKTNTKHIDFNTFLSDNGLTGQDDETVTAQLILSLSRDHMPRIALENFPQNITQAKYFSRNGVAPSHIFTLNCSKDVSQERMIDLGENHPNYISSTILSKMIAKYHEDCVELIPFLKSSNNLIEVNTSQTLEKSMEEVCKHLEPLVIHVRPGGSADLRNQMVEKLSAEHGFINLDVEKCIRGENERGTACGMELNKLTVQGKIIPAELIVNILRKIIYCGTPSCNKFILSNFPEQIEQAKEFEDKCCKIAAIIYPTGSGSVVEIKGNNLSLYNIDSLFQKEFRLKTMSEWSYQLFDEKLGNKVEYGVIVGKSLSGKTTIANKLAEMFGTTILDMKAITGDVKSKLGTEEEPFEGEVPIAKVEEEICRIIEASKSSPTRQKFLFDGYTHAKDADFLAFVKKFGSPDFIIFLTADDKLIKERWMKKNETEEIPEE